MSFEFNVEPSNGIAHITSFFMTVTSQNTFDGLFTYIFGYVDPQD